VRKLRQSQLDALVGEATVDCYNDDQQLSGLFTMIEDNLALPFGTQVIGAAVTLRRVDLVGTGSWRSVNKVVIGRRSRSWTCRCRTHRPTAGSGSRRTGIGAAEL
jgi:hypothetical protein